MCSRIAYIVDCCGDRGEYGSVRDKEHYIDNEGFRGFVGRSELFDYFSLIIAFYADHVDLFEICWHLY